MRPSRLALLPAAALLLVACSSGDGATASPSVPSSPAPSAASTQIDVTLTDQLRMEPAPLTVPAGVPVTFVVTNSGAIQHEFYIGDEEAQAEHEQDMQAGGMAHGEPAGISVAAGETKELTYTFAEPGETLAGCHEPGHYAGGMKATITVGG
jgi:uncharacterized cupredoxin-like copper-binding protein